MGSGWVFEGGKRSDVTVLTFNPFRGNSYIKTPDYVPARSVINVQNKDDQCFKWAVLSALYPVADHPERVAKYTPYENKLNWDGVKFPASLKDVTKFEANNPDISICVYRYEGKNPRPVFISKRMNKAEPTYREVDLLIIVEDEKQHYVWIKNFDTFCHRYNKSDHKKYTCRRCLKVFSAEHYRTEHLELCEGINKGALIIQMPKKGEVLEFTDGHKLLKAPFIIYADFECFNGKCDEPNFKHPCEDSECEDPDCIREKKKMKRTIKTTEQEANSYCYCVVRSDGETRGPYLYRGPDAVNHFFESMEKEIDLIYKVFDDPKPIIIDDTVYDAQEQAVTCWACEKEMGEDRVMHHDHLTGKFIGMCHNTCNLKMRLRKFHTKLPVAFHNLRGYDSHLLLAALGDCTKFKHFKRISCIPNNMEKYMSFTIGPLKFIDSYQLCVASLDSLVSVLKEEDLIITRAKISDVYTKGITPEGDIRGTPLNELFGLLRQKGTYPYEYISDYEKFNDTTLPPIETFYSNLSKSGIDMKEYQHAQNVWNKFECTTLGEYHDIYLKTDVLLLADVFEKFRKVIINYFKLDPAHFISAAGLSWSAMLRMTKVKLELITDVDMHMFIEKGIRGGISTVATKRYAQANNKYLPDYKPEEPSSYIMYFDANSLYAAAMSKKLPTHNFTWRPELVAETPEQLDEVLDLIMTTDFDDDIERIYEVDLEYPPELHDLHNDYPLAPEAMVVDDSMYSEYQQMVAQKINKKILANMKLVPNLQDKNYILHGQALKLYLQLGLKLTKVHKVLQFEQSDWLQQYISFNIKLRKDAKNNKFESNQSKLMNNSVYGKTMENLRKRMRVDLVKSTETTRINKLTSSALYIEHRIFPGGLIAIHSRKAKLKLNRPIYVGLAVLDISKWIMYNFWYNQIKKEFGNNAELVYTDTDSLIILFTATPDKPDVYEFLSTTRDYYDFSEYPKDHICYDTTNEKVVGKFKDEALGRPISEVVVR